MFVNEDLCSTCGHIALFGEMVGWFAVFFLMIMVILVNAAVDMQNPEAGSFWTTEPQDRCGGKADVP